ncbi:MAG: CPBP family glutamic-type intramembrane protease [Pseudomonadota bacterium]|nr:CPBP family glutamic-type intramembrane protease [Pseudomonadota bacterium]
MFASCVLFAFVHFNFLFPGGLGGIVMSFEIFLMGADLAYIFEQCGSLWPGITLQVINSIGVVAYLMAT